MNGNLKNHNPLIFPRIQYYVLKLLISTLFMYISFFAVTLDQIEAGTTNSGGGGGFFGRRRLLATNNIPNNQISNAVLCQCHIILTNSCLHCHKTHNFLILRRQKQRSKCWHLCSL
jgi:hypothetical protein